MEENKHLRQRKNVYGTLALQEKEVDLCKKKSALSVPQAI